MEKWKNTEVVECSDGGVVEGEEKWRGMFFCGRKFFSVDPMRCRKAKHVPNSPCKCACV